MAWKKGFRQTAITKSPLRVSSRVSVAALGSKHLVQIRFW